MIARELAEFTQRFGVQHDLRAQAPSLRLSPKRSTAVYRIFHEAITNVARHAQAQRVTVSMDIEGECFVLTLADDGIGFDAMAKNSSALGLLSMAERAREIGADLAITSTPGAGTRLVLSAPLL